MTEAIPVGVQAPYEVLGGIAEFEDAIVILVGSSVVVVVEVLAGVLAAVGVEVRGAGRVPAEVADLARVEGVVDAVTVVVEVLAGVLAAVGVVVGGAGRVPAEVADLARVEGVVDAVVVVVEVLAGVLAAVGVVVGGRV